MFGNSSTSDKQIDPMQTIVDLQESITRLGKRQHLLETKIEELVTEAKAHLSKKRKDKAVFCMKKKKMYETEIDTIMNSTFTIEQQIMSIEGTLMNQRLVKAMQMGTDTMKETGKSLDIDKVDDVMDDINDEIDNAREIDEAISRPVETDVFDEDELMDELMEELNELEEADLEAMLLTKPPVDNVDIDSSENAIIPLEQNPSVPNNLNDSNTSNTCNTSNTSNTSNNTIDFPDTPITSLETRQETETLDNEEMLALKRLEDAMKI